VGGHLRSILTGSPVASPSKELITEAIRDAMNAAIDSLSGKSYNADNLRRFFQEEVDKVVGQAREDWETACRMGLSRNGYEGFVTELKRAALRAAKRL